MRRIINASAATALTAIVFVVSSGTASAGIAWPW